MGFAYSYYSHIVDSKDGIFYCIWVNIHVDVVVVWQITVCISALHGHADGCIVFILSTDFRLQQHL